MTQPSIHALFLQDIIQQVSTDEIVQCLQNMSRCVQVGRHLSLCEHALCRGVTVPWRVGFAHRYFDVLDLTMLEGRRSFRAGHDQ